MAEECFKITTVARSGWFGILVVFVIVSNTLSMAVQADYPAWDGWLRINTAFLIFFITELLLRFLSYGCTFFTDPKDYAWNIFDFIVVILGCLDLCSRILTDNKSASKLVTIIRVVRILRILRILRLLKQFRQLAMLARGLIESVYIVFWIAVMFTIFLLVCAIFCTNIIGHAAEEFPDPDEIRQYWGGVCASMSTLFQFLTLDDWAAVAQQVTNVMPAMQLFFVFYIVFAAFVIASLLTGVMAEHMNNVRQIEDQEQLSGKFDEADSSHTSILKAFESADADNNDSLDQQEFTEMLSNPAIVQDLGELGVRLDVADAGDIFAAFDKGQKGHVSSAEFLTGMQQLRDGVTSRQILTLHGTILQVDGMLDEMKNRQFCRAVTTPQFATEKLEEACKLTASAEQQLFSAGATIASFIRTLEKMELESTEEPSLGMCKMKDIHAHPHRNFDV